MEFLQVKNLSFEYPKRSKKALDNISFSVKKGEFVLLYGESGCGKTTLLQTLITQIAPIGKLSGSISFNGKDISNVNAGNIGFVSQQPDGQIVTDRVWSELAFGPENLGIKPDIIKGRIAEMSNYFGIQGWFHKSTYELSGGQKQILNLASVMITQPKLLILDEPTAQLDPVAASEFISVLRKINNQFGITVILSEHRTEDILPYTDRILVMESGKLLFDGTPKNACIKLKNQSIFTGFPASAKIWKELGTQQPCPISVKDGKSFLENICAGKNTCGINKKNLVLQSHRMNCAAAVQIKNIWFRYSKEEKDILKNTSLNVNCGEIFTLFGGNASGKSTLLNLMSGLNRPYKGKIKILGKDISTYKNNSLYQHCISFLPQDPKSVFTSDTIRADYEQTKASDEQKEKIIKQLEISNLLDRHPLDLSGGELQKCALARLILNNPQILLLDEPTKGMDEFYKDKLGKYLMELKSEEKTIIIVSHDIEFAAKCSDRCAMLFDGEISLPADPHTFFSENYFYTTAASRISREIFKNTILFKEVTDLCKEILSR